MHRPIVAILDADGPRSDPVDLAETGPDGSAYRRSIAGPVFDRVLEARKAGCFIAK
jgi:hypothetical protein